MVFSQSSMFLYSLLNQRIEYKIDLKNEQFISSTIDKYGIFFETKSFISPRKVYRIDFNQLEYRQPHMTTYSTVKPMLWKSSKIINFDELEEEKLEVRHEWFRSFDGTKVPMTIIQKRDVDDNNRPIMVYAYGGYGIPTLPIFKLFFLLFIELFNGVVGSY